MSGRDIATAASRYLGVPWRHQGRDRKLGIDCVGLLVLVAQDLGLEYMDKNNYTMRPVPAEMIAVLDACCDRVEVAEEGDIMAFFCIGDGWPQHVAIKTRTGMVHATRGARVVVHEAIDEEWMNKFEGAWRYRWPR